MANGLEEYNEEAAQRRFVAGAKLPFTQEANRPVPLTFVDGFGANFAKINGSGMQAAPMPILDSWCTRRLGGK
jgi:hypothetical protein